MTKIRVAVMSAVAIAALLAGAPHAPHAAHPAHAHAVAEIDCCEEIVVS
jgi:hypothetical protein